MKKSARHGKPVLTASVKDAVIHLPNYWIYGSTVWALGVLILYLTRYPIPWSYVGDIVSTMTDVSIFHAYIGHVLFGFAVGLALLVLMTRGGALLTQTVLPSSGLARHELWVVGSALGVGFLASIGLGLGALHLWNRGVFMIVAVSLGLWETSIPLIAAVPPLSRSSPWTLFWKFLLALVMVLYLVGAAAPEIFYDSLHYHLAIPNLYRLEHRVLSVPTMLYADFVMTVQTVYGLAITSGNTLSAKAIHIGLSFLLGIGFITFARRFFSSASGWLASLLYFSIPMVGINATTAGTDVAGTFLLFASSVALILALEQPSRRAFQWAGALTGIAASTKYPAFLFIPLAGLLIVWHYWRDEKKPWREWGGYVLHFSSIALLFLAPILLKNSVLHGNPIFPFGGTFFGHPRLNPQEWSKFVSDTSPRNLRVTCASLPALGHFIAAPWFLAFEGQGPLGPVLLMGLPFLFRRSNRSLAYRFFQRYAALLWIVWLLTSTVPRYGLPTMVLLCPLLAEALLNSVTQGGVRWLLLGGMAIGIISNITLQLIILFGWEGWQVVAGKVSEATYLGRMHATYPTPPYDGLIWMNENLPQNARVLFAGESRSYYLERRMIPSSIPGPQPVVVWSHEAKSSQELAQKMRAAGVTHIFVNLMEALRTDSYEEFRWDPKSWATFDEFWTHSTRLIWKKESQDRANPQALYVFEVVPESIASQPHSPTANPFVHWKPT